MRDTTFILLLTLTASSYGQQQPAPQAGSARQSIMCDHAAPPRGTHWRCDDKSNPCNCRLESDTPGKSPLEDDGLVKTPELVGAATKINADDFSKIMNSLADNWSEGNAAKAAEVFTDTVSYTDSSRGQTCKGKQALSRLFGGNRGQAKVLKVQWHHLLFDERAQIGAGEFSLEGYRRHHGMAIVKVEEGKISNWREYQVPSNLSWDRFISDNPF